MRSLIKRIVLRDLFFFCVGGAILYHEIWVRKDPSPLGVFMVIFFWGLIPAFRGEDGGTNPWDLVARLLGGHVVSQPEDPVGHDPVAPPEGESSSPLPPKPKLADDERTT